MPLTAMSLPTQVSKHGDERPFEEELPAPVPQLRTFRRPLSDNELSYFLPSRADGLNDMFVIVVFRAPMSLITPVRIAMAWAIIRLRHTLFASQIEMPPGQYDIAEFSYTPPSSSSRALLDAKLNLEINHDQTAEANLDSYMNRRPILSSDRLSYLYSTIPPPHASSLEVENHSIVLSAKHCVGDGTSMHSILHELLSVLGGPNVTNGPPRTDAQLAKLLDHEWSLRWASHSVEGFEPIASSTEARFLPPNSKLQAAAFKVDFLKNQETFIGGHMIPRARASTFKNVTSDISYDPLKTEAILAKCKSNGVTMSTALFVLCNFAWIRTMRARALLGDSAFAPETLPMMMYTAINLRPYLSIPPAPPTSYLFLSLAYFNIVLPSFLPSASSPTSIFWHRARWVKAQKKKYLKSPMLVSRSQVMGVERSERAKVWAKEDDGILAGASAPSLLPAVAIAPPTAPKSMPTSTTNAAASSHPPPPSAALMGLTLIGDIDDIYHASSYPAIELRRLASHTRKTKGKMLMCAYKFRGSLYITLGWDAHGFRKGIVEEFWERVHNGVEEFLVDQSQISHRL